MQNSFIEMQYTTGRKMLINTAHIASIYEVSPNVIRIEFSNESTTTVNAYYSSFTDAIYNLNGEDLPIIKELADKSEEKGF